MEKDEEDEFLVEEREEKLVPSIGSNVAMERKGCFLKPISSFKKGSDFAPPFAPSRHEAIALEDEEPPKIVFKGWLSPQRMWGEWVGKMRGIYEELWKKVGILDAILASTCNIKRDPVAVWGLVAYWCEETNTFVFPWGEATITLEDVMVLGGFSVLGEPVRGVLDGELAEIEEKMIRELRGFNRMSTKKPEHSAWMRHYMERDGDELEHISFLALWLSRYVLPAHPDKTVGQYVLQIAIRLARGVRIALAPAVLANVYRDLKMMREHLVGVAEAEESSVVVWGLFKILQLWLWERFTAMKPETQSVVEHGQPKATKWHEEGKKMELSFVKLVVESPYEFKWRSYTSNLEKWHRASFYKDGGEWFHGNAVKDDELGAFLRCLRACELVGVDCIEQYLPHRVAMQFGLDQDIPASISRADTSWEVAWATYEMPENNIRFYVPPLLSEGNVTLRYSIWWKECMQPCTVAKQRVRRLQSAVKNVGKIPSNVSMLNGKKRKFEDSYGTKLVDWLSVRIRHTICSSKEGNFSEPSSNEPEMQNPHSSLMMQRTPKKKLSATFMVRSEQSSDSLEQNEKEGSEEPEKASTVDSLGVEVERLLSVSAQGEANCEDNKAVKMAPSSPQAYANVIPRFSRKIMKEKKRMRISDLPRSKKRKVEDAYARKLSEWLFLRKSHACNKSLSNKAVFKKNGCAIRQKASINLKASSMSGDEVAEIMEQSKEQSNTESRELSSSEIKDSEQEDVIEDMKSNNDDDEFICNAVEIDELEGLQRQQIEESTNQMVKELELEMQIEKLKEEIAVIQARVMDLESLNEASSVSD